MPKITIDTKGQDVNVSIETEGKLVINDTQITQNVLPFKSDVVDPKIFNGNGVKLASDAQRARLEKEGLFKEGMTAGEAWKIINHLNENLARHYEEKMSTKSKYQLPPQLTQGNVEPLPWEEQKKKRGRPKKGR